MKAKTNTPRLTVVGVFEDRSQAQKAVEELRRAGFRENQIGVVAHDHDATVASKDTSPKTSHAAAGAATGVAAGAGAGALWALGIAAGVLPAIGPVIAGGLLASVLASAAGAAAAGGVVGALIGAGLPEEEASYYEGEFKAGRTLVTVHAEGREDEARTIFLRHGAYDRSTAPATASQVKGGSQTVEVREEELRPRKRKVQKGEVKIRKEVHTEHQTIDVPVEREEVVIERRRVPGRQTSASKVGPTEEIRIPVSEEEIHVEKRPVVKEEVTVGKRKVKGTNQVSGTVRKERVKVEREGNVEVRDTSDVKRSRKP